MASTVAVLASRLLRRLNRLKSEYGGDSAGQKLTLLRLLEHRRLPRPGDVLRLHEVLCFLRAYPDDARVLEQVERMLAGFARRGDLLAQRARLVDSGIAGTEIRFRFFASTASWLAQRWPRQLTVDWPAFKARDRLDRWLPLLTLYAETPALDEYDLDAKQWLDRLKGPSETDATFLIRRFDALRVDAFVREKLYDELDPPMRLAAGPGTPSRTSAKAPRRRIVYQSRPLERHRPDLGREIRTGPVAVREAGPREARAMIDLAREAMVTRSRDLDVFSYADARDVRVVDCGEGLEFAAIGFLPERRLLLEAVYGFLTLKNGVPIGYVLASALFGSSEIAYNVFETYRGAEAARVYGRVLGMARSFFGSDTFTIYPYQLGHDNAEALRSGAWWFYRKLGFEPRDAGAVATMRREERRMKADPGHRSSRRTLERLAASNLYYFAGHPRADVMGILSLPDVGLRISRFLGLRFGSDRERAASECSRKAARLLGLRTLKGWTRAEREAWIRWAPLVLILPGVERWSVADKREMAAVVKAKGGRRESDFVLRFDRHRRLRGAIRHLAREDAD